MIFPQMMLDLHGELIVDLFAGGGGASCGIEMALGRQVDLAVNHDAAAVALHQANHPQTRHHVSDVFEVDPRAVTEGRSVGLLWASPDCTHHSKARGGKPLRDAARKRRALAWVVTRWAGQVRPRVIALENVEEFADWGPLVGPPDQLRPCPRRKGRTFRKWIRSLERLGYAVEWRELRACDYGAPTIRKRLFLIARCDGRPIVWPEPTHGPGRLPYRTAAECIDWSIPMLSIFATREEAKAWGRANGQAPPVRPLAEATQRRIARGVMRYVVQNPEPFIVGVGGRAGQSPPRSTDTPYQTVTAKGDAAVVAPVIARTDMHLSNSGCMYPPEEPLRTVTTAGGHALVAPFLSEHANASQQRTFPADEPMRTQVAGVKGGHFSLAAPVLVRNQTGERTAPARRIEDPMGAVLAHGANSALVSPFLVPRYGERDGQEPRTRSVEEPAPVVVPTGNGGSLAAVHLSPYHAERREGEARGATPDEPVGTVDTSNRHALVAGFLAKHYSGVVGTPLGQPQGSVTSIDHHSLVAAHIQRDFGTSVGHEATRPVGTITSDFGGHAALVASFLQKYYGSEIGQDQGAAEPLDTIPTRDRFGLVTVEVQGQPYVIADIAMRMLQPRELYTAQGFPASYVIDRGADGRRLTKTEQVRMCGNSVCPPIAAALARANVPEMIARDEALPAAQRRRPRRVVAVA